MAGAARRLSRVALQATIRHVAAASTPGARAGNPSGFEFPADRHITGLREGLLAYVTFGAQASGTVNGLPIRPGMMLAAEPATEVSFVADPGWESITFLLPPQDMRAHLAARQRETGFRLPQGMETLQANPQSVHALRFSG